MKKLKDYESEILDIIRTKDWNRAKGSNHPNLYQYIKRHKDIDENCRIIWEHISQQSRDFESEILEIVETKNWDGAKWSNDDNLYYYVKRHKDIDENCRIIWEHIRSRDYKSEILDIIKTKDRNRAKLTNDINLYNYIRRHKDTDENCRIIWEHISRQSKDYKSEILEIVETKNWDRAKSSNDINLYLHIHRHKDIDENCRIIWEHIKAGREPLSIKRYLFYYFKYGKPKRDGSLRQWFAREINRGNQCCIDIKNLIVAADTYKDSVAIETLELIKNHLEREGI